MSSTTIKLNSRESWLQARSRSIGSSESRVLIGEGYATESQLALWAEKCWGIESTIHNEQEKREALEEGRIMEPATCALFSHRTGLKAVLDDQLVIHCNPDNERMTATTDATIYDGPLEGILELKSIGDHAAHEWTDGPPLKVLIQVQHQLACRPDAAFAYAMPFTRLRREKAFRIERDDDLIASLSEHITWWWEEYVDAQVSPPPCGAEATRDAITALYPADDSVIHLPSSYVAIRDQLEWLQAEIRDNKKAADKIKNEIRLRIGGAAYAILPDGRGWSNKESEVHESARPARIRTQRTLRSFKRPPKGIQ